MYFNDWSRRRSCVSPPPAVVPDNPMSEKACETRCGSYLETPSASSVFWRPKVIDPKVCELKPTSDCWKAWPATLESRFVVCTLTARPLFCARDLNASLISPDCGLKKVSSLKMPFQSPTPKGSRPERPTRDWLRLLGVAPTTEWLLSFCTMSALPAGK